MEWVVNATPQPLYPKERDPVSIVQEAGREKSPPPPPGVRSPDSVARSDSLYRLRYPGPRKNSRDLILNFRKNVEP